MILGLWKGMYLPLSENQNPQKGEVTISSSSLNGATNSPRGTPRTDGDTIGEGDWSPW
jgi:hypothetical protein